MSRTIDFESIQAHYNLRNVQRDAYALAAIERTCSYADFARSSRYAEEALRRAGFSCVERIAHPADGVTSAFDCAMPQAWTLDTKKRSFLEIVDDSLPPEERLLADTRDNPLHANIWSAPTPKGGLTAELVAYEEVKKNGYGVAKGKWILWAPDGWHDVSLIGGVYHNLAEAGAAGLVVTSLFGADILPNDLRWQNGNGYGGWYLLKGDRHLPAFAITPLVAWRLQERLRQGKVVLHGELHCRVHDGEIWSVTGVIPGESDEEVALLAHIYEPFVNDDAAGFASCVELGRQLVERKVKLKRTLRVVFSMELYGTSAYLKERGAKIVVAASCDGIARLESSAMLVRQTPAANAFFTDWLVADTLAARLPDMERTDERANYSDDTFASDPYFRDGKGIPTFWIHTRCYLSHHSTGYLFQPDWQAAGRILPVIAEIVEKLLCATKLPDYTARATAEFRAAAEAILKDARLDTFSKQCWLLAELSRQVHRLDSVAAFTGGKANLKPLAAAVGTALEQLPPLGELTAAEYHALNLIPVAGPYGRPFSQGAMPKAERRPLLTTRTTWAWFNGQLTLLECIRRADAEAGKVTPPEKIEAILDELKRLEKFGYVKLEKAEDGVSAQEFAQALKELGVTKGMKLMVHATFSSLGNTPDAPLAYCKALQKAVGKDGLLMMPAFTFKVYNSNDPTQVFDVRNTPGNTGILAETFRKMPDVLRSIDPCHSFCAWGMDARKYVEGHHLVPTVDPLESPLGLLHHDGGYVLTISCCSAVTYMHLVEDAFGADCCARRTEAFRTILPDGREVTTRSWGWREKTCPECPAEHAADVFALIRKAGDLREATVGCAHLLLFPLEAYRKAYAALLKKNCKKCVKPRKRKNTVASDWDEKRRRLKKTDAYTGPWMP